VSAEGILRRAARLLPASRAEYGEALLAELGALPNNERRRWLLGGGAFVLRELVIHNGPYAAGLACAVLALVAVDRSPSDIANQASLLVLLLTAGGLGLTRPHRAWFAGLVVGSCLAAAHAAYLAWGVALPYPMSPSGWAGALSLLLLLLPAFVAAYAGAAIRRAIQRRR
jgi:hypothetical protein